MRCLTLADAMRQRGCSVTFLCSEETPETVPALKESGFEIKGPDAQPSCDLLVVDHYGLGADYETAARAWAKKILVLDDLADRKHDCDYLLVTNLAFAEADYRGKVPEFCRIYSGPDYLLLRREFREGVRTLRKRRIPPKRILLFFGMTDSWHLTLRYLKILKSLVDLKPEIDVVIGEACKDKEEIKTLCLSINACLHVQINDMARLMKKADLALSCGGTAIWERISLGLPALEIAHSDWQVETLTSLDKQGYLKYTGKMQDLEDSEIACYITQSFEKGVPVKQVSCGGKIDDMVMGII